MRLHYNTFIANRQFTPFEQAAREVVLDYQIHRINKGSYIYLILSILSRLVPQVIFR